MDWSLDVELLRSEAYRDTAGPGLEGRRLAVVGKGKQERAWLTINGPTVAAVAGWIQARGTDRGALGQLDRLTHAAVRRLGSLAGLAMPARPHGLRHAATTR